MGNPGNGMEKAGKQVHFMYREVQKVMEMTDNMTEEEYSRLIIPYQDAMANLMTRLEALNNDYRLKYKNYPIHYIHKRIKKKKSIEDKLRKRQIKVSAEEARESLTDIAGVRIICYFVDDIYGVLSLIKRQSDILVLKEKDYIKNSKKNGYRSYHLVIGVPVYHTDGMEYYPVEIQLRTLQMELWASMEHRICYKSDRNVERDAEIFLGFAHQLEEMENILHRMEKNLEVE